MMIFLTDWLLHSEYVLILIEFVFSAADDELPTGFKQGVDLVMYIINSGFSWFGHMYRWVHKHALAKGRIKIILVSYELRQVLNLILLILITANDAYIKNEIWVNLLRMNGKDETYCFRMQCRF